MAIDYICNLAYAEAVKAIEGAKTVFFKSGVWNKFQEIDAETAKKRILNSSYGADVWEDGGRLYVSCPSEGDMF